MVSKRNWLKIIRWAVYTLGCLMLWFGYDARACGIMLIVCAAVALAVAAEIQDAMDEWKEQTLMEIAFEMALKKKHDKGEHDSCEGCRHDLGGGQCRINLEGECGKGEHEAWEEE